MNKFRWFIIILVTTFYIWIVVTNEKGLNPPILRAIVGFIVGISMGFMIVWILEGFFTILENSFNFLKHSVVGDFIKWLIPRAILGIVTSVSSAIILDHMGIQGAGNAGVSIVIFSLTMVFSPSGR